MLFTILLAVGGGILGFSLAALYQINSRAIESSHYSKTNCKYLIDNKLNSSVVNRNILDIKYMCKEISNNKKLTDKLRILDEHWSESQIELPSDQAIKNAKLFLEYCTKSNISGFKIYPSVLGGIVISRKSIQEHYIEFYNNGQVNIIEDAQSESPEISVINPYTDDFKSNIKSIFGLIIDG